MTYHLSEEQALNARLLEKSGRALEKALDRALRGWESGALEVKEVIRRGRDVQVKVGPVATLESVRALYREVRAMVYTEKEQGFNDLGGLKRKEPEEKTEPVKPKPEEMTTEQLMRNIRAITGETPEGKSKRRSN